MHVRRVFSTVYLELQTMNLVLKIVDDLKQILRLYVLVSKTFICIVEIQRDSHQPRFHVHSAEH